LSKTLTAEDKSVGKDYLQKMFAVLIVFQNKFIKQKEPLVLTKCGLITYV